MNPTAHAAVIVTAIPAVSRWDQAEESGVPCGGRRAAARLEAARSGLNGRPDDDSGEDMSDQYSDGCGRDHVVTGHAERPSSARM